MNWLVDGATNIDVGSNITLLSTPTLESIEEFKIITSGYNAEWPRSGGGIINVVTKSGTNTFPGFRLRFFRNDALNANSFFRKHRTHPDPARQGRRRSATTTSATRWADRLKEQLFFFWSQEWRQIRAPVHERRPS